MPKKKTSTTLVVCVAGLLAAGLKTGLVKYERLVHLERVQGIWEGAMDFHAGRLLRAQRMVLGIFEDKWRYPKKCKAWVKVSPTITTCGI